MFFIDTAKKSLELGLSWARLASQQVLNVALVLVLLFEGVIESSEQAASDLQLWMKVIRSNSIN